MAGNKQTTKRKIISWLLISAGIVGLIVCATMYFHSPKLPTYAKSKAVDVNVAPSSIKPKQTAVASYNVPPTNPKYITIPSIGLDQARVVRLGLTSSNQIATPSNIYDAGWYDGSALPGQTGSMFIYGHVSSWTADGAFYNLKKLKPGDTITITRGDNTTYTYKVVTSKVYPYDNVNMQEVLSPIDENQPGLNLMTCTGSIIKGTSDFNERLVVFTKLVSG